MRQTSLRANLSADQNGATAVEYALIITCIAIAVTMTVKTIGQHTEQIFQAVSEGFDR
ncbi:MAG: Flp family type IVb pilin [Pseudomonadota bacterium]